MLTVQALAAKVGEMIKAQLQWDDTVRLALALTGLVWVSTFSVSASTHRAPNSRLKATHCSLAP